MGLNAEKLENVRQRGGKTTAACPACRESGADRSGEHLVILAGGKWGCIANTGDAGKEHRRRIAELVGDDQRQPAPYRPAPRPTPVCKPARPLPPLFTPTPERLRQIAASRGHSADGMEVLVERGMLFTAEVWDDGQTWPAWVCTDPSRANAQARKMDRGVWTGIGGKKPKSLNAHGGRSIGACAIGNRPEVWLVEGTPDLCAAPIVARLAGLDLDQIAFVCITGAGNSIHADDLLHFAGKIVTIAVHNDTDHGKGAEAANRWAAQLYQAGAREVVGFDFAGTGGKDLSDYLKNLTATNTPETPQTPPEPKETPAPAGLCIACWSRRVIAVTDGPTCTCRRYVWPIFTPAQLTADSGTN
jgi:hypothetical protein